MENPGLGTLAILPREIRDMIFDLLFSDNDCPCTGRLIFDTVFPIHDLTCKRHVAISADVKEVKRVFSERLSPMLRTKCSRQFYRECLESYLRSIIILFEEQTQDISAITHALQSLNTVAGIASHMRKLSVSCHLRIAYRDCLRTYFSMKEFLIEFAETLKTLKRCEGLFGITASKLSIAVFFDDIILSISPHSSIGVSVYRSSELIRTKTDLRACLKLPIEIAMGDRAKSVQNMETWCGVVEKLMYKCLTLTSEDPGVLSNHWANSHVQEVIAKVRSMIKHTLTRVKELQLLFIDIAMQYWEDEDEEELENVCRRLRWKGKHADNG